MLILLYHTSPSLINAMDYLLYVYLDFLVYNPFPQVLQVELWCMFWVFALWINSLYVSKGLLDNA